MSVIFVLIGIGIVVAGGFLAAFIWAVKSGQYDDDYTPSVRMLFDSKKSKSIDSQDNKDHKSKDKKQQEAEQSNKLFPA